MNSVTRSQLFQDMTAKAAELVSQQISVLLHRFNSVLLHRFNSVLLHRDSFVSVYCPIGSQSILHFTSIFYTPLVFSKGLKIVIIIIIIIQCY